MGSLKLYKLERGIIVYDPSADKVIYSEGHTHEEERQIFNYSRNTGEVQIGDVIRLFTRAVSNLIDGGLVKEIKEISQGKYLHIKEHFDKQKRAYDLQVERIMQETKSQIEDLKRQEEERINKLAKPSLESLLEGA